MANKENKLINWIFEHREILNLAVNYLNWTSELLPDYFDLEVSITIEGEKFIGRGTDKKKSKALLKATSEALERYICSEYSISTNGVALHSKKSEAKDKAKKEILERDSFFSYFLTKKVFPLAVKNLFVITPELKKQLKRSKININLWEISTTDSEKIIICVAKGYEDSLFGLNIGLGCEASLERAQEKAIIEVLRNVAVFLSEGPTIINFKNADYEDLVVVHLLRAIKSENRNILRHCTFPNNLMDTNRSLTFNPRVKFTRLVFKNRLLKDAPLYAYRATSRDVQNAFWGETTLDKINLDRLSRFAGKTLQLKDLDLTIHPLG